MEKQMNDVVATFGEPKDITNNGVDGKVYRFPVSLIEREDIGTPRQPSKTKLFRIEVAISGSRIKTWKLEQKDLIKVIFQIAREELNTIISSGNWTGKDVHVRIDTQTHRGPCPFNPALIPEPSGAVVEFNVRRQIGFM
jgi:hypothetical protein